MTVSGLSSNSRVFTVRVEGLLSLKVTYYLTFPSSFTLNYSLSHYSLSFTIIHLYYSLWSSTFIIQTDSLLLSTFIIRFHSYLLLSFTLITILIISFTLIIYPHSPSSFRLIIHFYSPASFTVILHPYHLLTLTFIIHFDSLVFTLIDHPTIIHALSPSSI